MVKTKIKKEKNMKTKILCLLLAMIMIIATLASCNFGDNGEGEGEDETGYTGTEYDVTWKKTELVYELNEHTQKNELSSGTRRYYAGDSQGKVDRIDTEIDTRNANAEKEANVTVKYTYVGTQQEGQYGWSANVDRIFEQTSTYGPGSVDIYCNFAYDMTCAAIKGSFANLKGTYGQGNFFEFNKTDYVGTGSNYFDAEAGKGYFYDYMKSLSLSDDKMFVLGSNYCTDLVRAFVVIPVHIGFLNTIPTDKLPEQSLVAAGKTNIQHFYDIVWGNKWTYDVLATYSNAVFANNNSAKIGDELGSANLGDKLGFAAGTTSGLVSSGLLYTTSIKIINKTSAGNGQYTYDYPTTNAGLTELAVALNKFFDGNKNNGVTTINAGEATKYDGSESELVAIRKEFSKGNILFGGVIMVGSLEDEVYQSLRANDGDGFGVAPVPLYKAYEEGKNEYQTLVHNVARIIGVAGHSTKFAQCSAYLDYLSRKSADILDEYYEGELASKVAGTASKDNSKMLTYIRNHVRDCFDKTYEDVIGNFNKSTSGDSDSNKWHSIFQSARFAINSVDTQYESLYPNKKADLDTVVAEWNKL